MNIVSSARSRSIKLTSRFKSSTFSRSNTADYGSLSWTFDTDNHRLSHKWTDRVYSTWVVRTVATSGIFLMLFAHAPVPEWVTNAASQVVYVFIYIPFFSLIVLSLNRDALGFIVMSSEFWIKVTYAIIGPILQMILYHQVGRHKSGTDLPEYLGYMYRTIVLILVPMVMFVFSAMDAIPRMKYKWKAILMGLLALQWTWEAVAYQMLVPVEDDYVIEIKATGSILSFHSLLASVCGMLAMFLWKQAIDVVRNKDRCISIAYRPYLNWESSRAMADMNVAVIPDIETTVIETNNS